MVIDESGARWLFPADGSPPRASEHVEVLRAARRWVDPRDGLSLVTPEGKVFATKTALGPYAQIAALPPGADQESLRSFDGVFTVRDPRGVCASTDGVTFTPIAPLPSFLASEIILDAKGRGVGLFLPETVARTTDRGATWTVVPTEGLAVTSIELVDGKPALRPGSSRDRFARSIDLETGALERVVARDAEDAVEAAENPFVLTSRRHKSQDPKRAEGGSEIPRPVRHHVPAGALGGWFSRRGDGDRVLDLPRAPYGSVGKQTLLVGRLGEGMLPLLDAPIERCEAREGAICGEITAVSCARQLHVMRGKERIATFPIASDASVGFLPDGTLVSVAHEDGTKAISLTAYDLGATPKSGSRELEGLSGKWATLIGGCHKPALWVSTGTHAARFDIEGLGAPVELPKDARFVGIDAARELIVTTWGERRPTQGSNAIGAELLYLPSGETSKTGLIFPEGMSFAEDGRHGLHLTREPRQLHQTDDGGRTWTPIETPSYAGHPGVACGESRCMLGEGVFRQGFTLDEGYVPPKHEAAAAAVDPFAPLPSPDARRKLPVVMSCRPDPSVFSDAPELELSLSPRVGDLAFAATVARDDLPGSTRTAVFGDVRGKATTESLGKVAPGDGQIYQPKNATETLTVGAPGFARHTARSAGRGELKGTVTTSYRWEPGAALLALVQPDVVRSGLTDTNLFGDDVFGQSEWANTLIVWGKQKPFVRRYVSKDRRWATEALTGPGVLALEGSDGVLLAVQTDEAFVRIVALGPDDQTVERGFRVLPSKARETALGVAPSADGSRKLVLVEGLPDGSTELRVRSLDARLALGPATVVPGTRTPRDHLLALPSCAAGTKGMLVRTSTSETVIASLGKDAAEGTLSRLLRVTATSACVERTMISFDRGIAASLVVVGNGGLGATQRGAVGVRCDAVDPRPLAALPTLPEPRR